MINKSKSDLEKKLLIEKMWKSSDRVLLVLYIEYLEKFTTNEWYSSINDLLSQNWFFQEEIEVLMSVLYWANKLDDELSKKILNKCNY